MITALDETAKSEIAASTARAERRRQHESQLNDLQRRVNNAQADLKLAQDRHDQFATRIKELRTIVGTLWSQETGAAGISPVAGLAEAYTNASALESAVADFVRIKKEILVPNLEKAKRALADFQTRSK